MGSVGPVMLVVLLTVGCGGVSSRSHGDGMSDAGALNGGTTASAGTGTGRTDEGGSGSDGSSGSTSGGATTGGSATGGTVQVPQPVDLGDGDHADDGRPVVPIDTTGGFFWRGCGSAGWRIGNWWVTSDRQRDALPLEIDPPRDTSTKARGASGADLPAGAVLWVELDHPQTRPVSLSGCSAISFWARLESPSGRVVLALNEGSRGSGLPEGRAMLPSRALDVGLDWQEFVLPFGSFPGLASEDVSLASIEFFVGDGGEKFELWIDDLSLVCAGGCPDSGEAP